MTKSLDGEEPRTGMFTGFDAYLTVSGDDYRNLLAEGLIVLDTNVLLNLYRYTNEAREDLLSVLDAIQENLWIPHQVLKEFWRNRDGVLRDPRDTSKAARELEDDRERTIRTFRTWANRVFLTGERSKELLSALESGFEAVMTAIDEFEDTEAEEAARDTSKDDVLSKLAAIIEGRCGSPLSDEAHTAAVKEGLRRIELRIPPGYMDKRKDDEEAVGDYLMWEQVLLKASSQESDVLLVTGDVKEDWWRKEHGEWRGPRPELAEEIRHRAGCRLFLLRPASFLQHAQTLLAVTIRDETVAAADRVEQFLSERNAALVTGGWDTTTVLLLLAELEVQAPVQREALLSAAQTGGYISRDEIYELGGYSEERSLRGFTRPITRITENYKADGLLPPHAVPILRTVYRKDSPKIGWASGFAIDEDVLEVFSGLFGDIEE